MHPQSLNSNGAGTERVKVHCNKTAPTVSLL